MRILVLLTDAFGGYGGIAHFRAQLSIDLSALNFELLALSSGQIDKR
jgi:hypothetical protein